MSQTVLILVNLQHRQLVIFTSPVRGPYAKTLSKLERRIVLIDVKQDASRDRGHYPHIK